MSYMYYMLNKSQLSNLSKVVFRTGPKGIPEETRDQMMLRLIDGLSQTEVAREFGVSQTLVSRIKKKYLAKL